MRYNRRRAGLGFVAGLGFLLISASASAQQGGEGRWTRMSQWDKNGDQKISADEFPGPQEFFSRMDSDGDGFVTRQESQQVPLPGVIGQDNQNRNNFRRGSGFGGRGGFGRGGRGGSSSSLMEKADTNKDQSLSVKEWTDFFKAIDDNGDDFLQNEELRAALEGRSYNDRAPQVGDPAPKVQAKRLSDNQEVNLTQLRRPTVLIFGSYT